MRSPDETLELRVGPGVSSCSTGIRKMLLPEALLLPPESPYSDEKNVPLANPGAWTCPLLPQLQALFIMCKRAE